MKCRVIMQPTCMSLIPSMIYLLDLLRIPRIDKRMTPSDTTHIITLMIMPSVAV